ncbi:MAG: hypothetical protein U0172_02570 [Nitrospiraceae bacterium]
MRRADWSRDDRLIAGFLSDGYFVERTDRALRFVGVETFLSVASSGALNALL